MGIHGGGWTAGSKQDETMRAKKLARLGIAAFAIDYRLAPSHKFPAQLEDSAAALAWVKGNADKLSVDPLRIAIWGYSAGGHLAALLGLLEQTVCVVAGGAPWDFNLLLGSDDDNALEFLMGGSRGQCPIEYRRVCPTANASGRAAEGKSFFLYHGSMDVDVPFSSALPSFAARLRDAGATVVHEHLLDRGDHLSAAIDHDCYECIIAFLVETLGVPRVTAASERRDGMDPDDIQEILSGRYTFQDGQEVIVIAVQGVAVTFSHADGREETKGIKWFQKQLQQ